MAFAPAPLNAVDPLLVCRDGDRNGWVIGAGLATTCTEAELDARPGPTGRMVALDYAWPQAVDPPPTRADQGGPFTRIWAPQHLIQVDDRGARLLGSTVAGPAGQALVDALNAPSPGPAPVRLPDTWERGTPRARYLEQVRRIQAHIQRGDIYELNYCVERTCTVPRCLTAAPATDSAVGGASPVQSRSATLTLTRVP